MNYDILTQGQQKYDVLFQLFFNEILVDSRKRRGKESIQWFFDFFKLVTLVVNLVKIPETVIILIYQFFGIKFSVNMPCKNL